jgi:hypothetical protein
MSPAQPDRPPAELVRRLLDQYAPTRLEASLDDLPAGDREALHALAEAARAIDRIYWNQRSEDGWKIRQSLRDRMRSRDADPLLTLVDLGFGPWDAFDSDRPFWGAAERPPGGAIYPRDLTRDELLSYIERHPDQRAALLAQTTLIRRRGADLVAVRYEEAYADDLAAVADAMRRAGRRVSDATFASFLEARASGLTSGDLAPSETSWVGLDSELDIAIGAYEVYDDAILGVKASYEAIVMRRHQLTDRLVRFEALADELGRQLPGAVAAPDARPRVSIGVYDVVYAGGRANMGAKAIAAMLPADAEVRRRAGSRLLLFRNVIAAKYEPILVAIARRVLRDRDADRVTEDAFLAHTLLHELAHALPAGGDEPSAAGTNHALRERYSTIEECRADLVGLVFCDLLVQRNELSSSVADAAAATFVAGLLRTLRFGADNDYGRAAAIVLSTLHREGAVTLEAGDRLAVDNRGVYETVRELAERVQAIAVAGDYGGAGELIETRGSLPDELASPLSHLEGIPIDVAFAFDDAFASRS